MSKQSGFTRCSILLISSRPIICETSQPGKLNFGATEIWETYLKTLFHRKYKLCFETSLRSDAMMFTIGLENELCSYWLFSTGTSNYRKGPEGTERNQKEQKGTKRNRKEPEWTFIMTKKKPQARYRALAGLLLDILCMFMKKGQTLI